MIKAEKTRSSAATLERAWDNADSRIHYTTPTKRAQVSVFDRLPQGEENAVRATELARLCGFKSVRELQSAVSKERESGALILSTCRGGGGYFRPSPGPAGKREINAFVATLASRALNTLRALKAANRELKTIDGQINFGELEEALRAVVAMEGADEQQKTQTLPKETI